MSDKFYRNPATGELLAERRSGMDRRCEQSFWKVFNSSEKRRKSRGRRKTDRGAYVDVYDARTWCVVAAILLLSLVDALLTGFHLVRGTARELNPILRAAIEHGGMSTFFALKAAMTVIPLSIIMVHKEWTLGRFAARLVLWAYVLLTAYHLILLLRVHGVA